MVMSYAVIFTYNFDEQSDCYLFDDYDTAKKFLKDSFDEELRIETEENEWDDVESMMNDTETYGEIRHYVPDGCDVCEYRLCTNVKRGA
jgi:hypothetical protein